ncbi:MAG TPA: phosphate propanoyltransferase [Candidatus Latescibacteria bacterium]|nr:phosphate propanoyltransferase [Candidatus Latescibacterota bacterium]
MLRSRSPFCQECGRCFDLEDLPLQRVEVERITREVVRRLQERAGAFGEPPKAIVGVSVRHVHLTRDALAALYGPGHTLTKLRDLYQPGQYAAQETVAVVGPRMRAVERVRILGPLRDHTQVELSRTDGFYLGLELPVRASGDIAGTPGVTLVGPYGSFTLKEGAIRADRHVHMSLEDAERWSFEDGEIIQVRAMGDKEVIFGRVRVRVSPDFKTELHLDTDDANAADLSCGDVVELVKR